MVYVTSRPLGAEPTVTVETTPMVALPQTSVLCGPVTLMVPIDSVGAGGGGGVVGGGAGSQAAGAAQTAVPVRMPGFGPSTSTRTVQAPLWVAVTATLSSSRAPVPLTLLVRLGSPTTAPLTYTRYRTVTGPALMWTDALKVRTQPLAASWPITMDVTVGTPGVAT